jgi:hypothetical protein
VRNRAILPLMFQQPPWPPGNSFTYIYDLGDEWRHDCEIEAVDVNPDRCRTCPNGRSGLRACAPPTAEHRWAIRGPLGPPICPQGRENHDLGFGDSVVDLKPGGRDNGGPERKLVLQVNPDRRLIIV